MAEDVRITLNQWRIEEIDPEKKGAKKINMCCK